MSELLLYKKKFCYDVTILLYLDFNKNKQKLQVPLIILRIIQKQSEIYQMKALNQYISNI